MDTLRPPGVTRRPRRNSVGLAPPPLTALLHGDNTAERCASDAQLVADVLAKATMGQVTIAETLNQVDGEHFVLSAASLAWDRVLHEAVRHHPLGHPWVVQERECRLATPGLPVDLAELQRTLVMTRHPLEEWTRPPWRSALLLAWDVGCIALCLLGLWYLLWVVPAMPRATAN